MDESLANSDQGSGGMEPVKTHHNRHGMAVAAIPAFGNGRGHVIQTVEARRTRTTRRGGRRSRYGGY